MEPIMITEENITEELFTDEYTIEALIAELEAFDLQKLAEQTGKISKYKTIEYRMAKYAALNVDFLETEEEFRLYADAIYNAVTWGQNIG